MNEKFNDAVEPPKAAPCPRFQHGVTSMSKRARVSSPRGGFTLPEILVTVAMVGVLAAVTLPAVMNQVNKGEISRVVQDLQNVGQAAQDYRAATAGWPPSTDSLVALPGTSITWAGPYLARTAVGAINTGAGGVISTTLGQATPSGATGNFLRIAVTGLTVADAEKVDLQIDSGETGNWYSTGRVRSVTATSTDPDLYFFPVSIK